LHDIRESEGLCFFLTSSGPKRSLGLPMATSSLLGLGCRFLCLHQCKQSERITDVLWPDPSWPSHPVVHVKTVCRSAGSKEWYGRLNCSTLRRRTEAPVLGPRRVIREQIGDSQKTLKANQPHKAARFNGRANAFQNISKSLNRNRSSHPARLNFPRKEPLDPSFCMALRTMCRSTARLCAPFPARVRS